MQKDKRYVYHEDGANLSVIKIAAAHCWCCGKQFQKKHKLTKHHSIPEELRPVRNVVVLLCEPCHKKIHQDSQAMNPKKVKVLNNLKKMKEHYKSIDEGFDKLIEDLK